MYGWIALSDLSTVLQNQIVQNQQEEAGSATLLESTPSDASISTTLCQLANRGCSSRHASLRRHNGASMNPEHVQGNVLKCLHRFPPCAWFMHGRHTAFLTCDLRESCSTSYSAIRMHAYAATAAYGDRALVELTQVKVAVATFRLHWYCAASGCVTVSTRSIETCIDAEFQIGGRAAAA